MIERSEPSDEVKMLQFQVKALESRMDQQSCTLAAFWNVLKESEGGRQILLRIMKNSRELYQTMELEHLISL